MATTAVADSPGFVFPGGCCYYEGEVVRTVVPPAAAPSRGIDPFFAFPVSAAPGQKSIVGVAPGDTDYHGGKWAFYSVVWNMAATPRVLTSEADVDDAEFAGEITVTRVEANDFKCPIQP
jgi:hypothetical protein